MSAGDLSSRPVVHRPEIMHPACGLSFAIGMGFAVLLFILAFHLGFILDAHAPVTAAAAFRVAALGGPGDGAGTVTVTLVGNGGGTVERAYATGAGGGPGDAVGAGWSLQVKPGGGGGKP